MKPSAEQPAVLKPIRVRRYFSVEDKLQILNEAGTVGNSISQVARKYGIIPTQLYQWRSQLMGKKSQSHQNSESVKVKELERKVKELERALGKQTMHVEILKEAIKIGREKKLISPKPLKGLEDFE